VNGIAFRGTYSTAFRSPSIGELFSGQSDDFPGGTDPCDTSQNGPLPPGPTRDQCIAEGLDPDGFQNPILQVPAKIGGNPELGPESAKIWTAGIVIEPPQVKGLALTVDVFDIVIDDAVQSEGIAVIFANCYERQVAEECDKIHRQPGTGVIDFVEDTLFNVGGNDTRGIDFAIAHQLETKGAGTFRHQLEGTYLLAYHLETADGTKLNGRGVYDLGVYPYIKGNFSEIWGRGPVSAGLNLRYIGGYKECENDDCNSHTNPYRHVNYNLTGDLWAGYRLETAAGQTNISAGVNNILDQDPPRVWNGFLADSDSNTYDYMGRYFYLRLTQAF
jgi:outer membrane receptor protein involved in Fe transport